MATNTLQPGASPANPAPRVESAPDIATFRINGTRLLINEPYEYLDQAHAMAAILSQVDGERAPNYEIVAACAEAIQTLISLAGLGLAQMDYRAEQRRAAK